MDKQLFFSVIIPSRNRPNDIKIALNSVLTQDSKSFEVLIINDGSDKKYTPLYQQIIKTAQNNVKLINLEQSVNGHGPSYSLNIGVQHAQGKFIAFLDDDDLWIDNTHLSTAQKLITETKSDLYLTLQKPYQNNTEIEQQIWLTPLLNILTQQNIAIEIDIKTLLKANGFAHRNNLIVNKKLYLEINGHDENIRYEEDKDFYLRSIDNAHKIIFNPSFISRHYIPDKKNKCNLSTQLDDFQKILFRLTSLTKLILISHDTLIINYAKTDKIYTLKILSEQFYQKENYPQAFYFAKEALAIGFNLKWFAFTLLCWFKILIRK